MPTLRLSLKLSPRGKSWTQIMKVCNTNHVADFRDLRPQLCRPLFLCIVTGLIPLERHKRVCRRLVTDFVANILTCWDGLCPWLSWFVSAIFTEILWFHRLSPRLFLQGSFGESRRNRIWAYGSLGFWISLCVPLFCSDIKPENVLIDREGHVKLVDFGSACRRNASASMVSADACWLFVDFFTCTQFTVLIFFMLFTDRIMVN